jgi:hypothetical protein
MRRPGFQHAFDKLAAAERQFLAGGFLAPMVGGGEVRVRIAGVVCRLRVTRADFRGFGIFRPTSHATADLVSPATLTQRRQYLALFPLVRLVLCRRRGTDWLAAPAHAGDRRFQIAGLVPLRLADEAQQFDIVRARFDGANFWHEGPEPARDPATAAWLRTQRRAGMAANLLTRPGLTPEERLAYALELPPPPPDPSADPSAVEGRAEESRQDAADRRLRDALRHAGAELVDYLERPDGYRVTYEIDGQRHISAIDKRDLTVQVAGICLSGADHHFDLASLVGVLREAEGTGNVYRMDD